MILFLIAFSLNRARTTGMFYEELLPHADNTNITVLDVSRSSLQEVEQQIGRAGLIVFDNSIILTMGKNPILEQNFYRSKKKSKAFYSDVWGLVEKADLPVFLLHPSSDLHARNFGLERELYLSILRKLTGIFWPYYRCPVDRNEQNERYPFTSLERFQMKKEDLISIWDEITGQVPVSIDFPHCLGPTELNSKEKRKTWDVIVPGVTYKTRLIALNSVEEKDLFVAPYTQFSRWLVYAPYLLYSKLLRGKQSTETYQKKSFRFYRYMISMSKVSFTCGSEMKFFVRKFLEVPAFRSAMIAYPSNNFSDYGFADGTHYLHSFPEEAGDKARFIIDHPGMGDQLIKNAWNLVSQEHMAANRVQQVIACLNAFRAGKLKRAGYHEGRFELIS